MTRSATSRPDSAASGPQIADSAGVAADASGIYRPAIRVSLSLALGAFQRGSSDPTQRRAPDGMWRTTLTPHGPGTLRLAMAGTDVIVDAWGPGARWLVEQVPALLGAADDLTGFAPSGCVVAETWRRLPHLRLPQAGVLFELLVPAILEQKVTGVEARRSWRELLWRFGTPAPGPAPRGMRVFPPASVWRRIPSWEWHRAGVDPKRTRTILAAAQVAHRLEESLAMSREERIRRLRLVPGVGVWTVAEVGQRAWGDPDLPSVGDFHIPGLVGWALAGRPVDDDGMLALLGAYPGHRHRAVRLIELSGVEKPRFGPRLSVTNHRAI